MAISRRFPGLSGCAALFATVAALAGPPTGGVHFGGVHTGGVHVGSGFHAATGAHALGLHGSGHGGAWVGASVHALPVGYGTYHFHGSPYYYAGGAWYRPWNGWYVGCYPPFGLCFPFLPFGYETYWDDGVRYYDYDGVTYTDAPAGGYMVAEPPADRTPLAEPMPGGPDAAALDALLIVPEKGQDAARMKRDRDDAQRFAMDKSSYDPAYADPQDPGTPRARKAYLKALKEYLEQRGYSVK